MPYTVVLHPEAEKEYLTSFLWYEERSPDLGERFGQAVESEIQSIAKTARHYRTKKQDYREARVSIFPFLIVYMIYPETKEIFIASIFHTSRRPGKKYRR